MVPGTQRALFSTLPGWVLALFLVGPATSLSQSSSNVPALLGIFKDSSQSQTDRIEAAAELSKGGPSSFSALPLLTRVWLDKGETPGVRLAAMSALKRIATNELTVVPGFMVVLKDKRETSSIRIAAFEAYLAIGPNLTAFTDVFARILADKEENQTLRDDAAKALGLTATKIAAHATKPKGSAEEINRAIGALEQIRRAFAEAGVELHPELTRALNTLVVKKGSLSASSSFGFGSLKWPWNWLFGLLIAPMICLGVWFLLLWSKPVLLWRVNDLLSVVPEVRLPQTEIPIGLRSYLLSSFFHYHPRVLDAWLASHWEEVARRFGETVAKAERKLHLTLPVAVNESVIDKPGVDDFRALFVGDRVCVLICGEGGSGKTTLACQIAKWAMEEQPGRRLTEHRMLPVLIQDELDCESPNGPSSLMRIIQKQTSELLGQQSEISVETVNQLLKHKRILVLLDGRSRRTDELRAIISSGSDSSLPIKTLIITSTNREALSDLRTGVIEPLRIEADFISKFMGAYLREKGKRDLFNDRNLLEGCVRLSEVTGERNVTPFLAKLYLDQMVAAKEVIRNQPLPENIPDLMLSLVNDLNQRVSADERLDPRTIHRWAELIAWECVKTECRPTSVKTCDIAEVLQRESPGAKYLSYVRDKLHLIRELDSNGEHFRMIPDTLAEYLAGLHLVELLGPAETAWRGFLSEAVKKHHSTGLSKDFILAVRDCCLAKGKGASIPDFVEVELGRLAGLDLTAIERARLEMRIRRLTQQLSLPNAEDRRIAAVGLGSIGPAAKSALPNLVARLMSVHENVGVRHTVIKVLGEIGAETEEVIPALIEALKDYQNRLRPPASKALIRIGTKAIGSLTEILKNKHEEEEFRVTAATTLGAFERDGSAAVPALIEVLHDPQEAERVRIAAAAALGRIGPQATLAVPDLINLMQQNKTLRRSAAKALVTIAPAARSCILSLFEALNQDNSDDPEAVLATFRLSLVQPTEPPQDQCATEIRRVVEDALKKIPAQTGSNLRSREILSSPA